MSDALVPFRVRIDDAAIEDLRARLGRTRFPDREPVQDWSQGTPLSYVQELCGYWQRDYDMRRLEKRLNAYEQFRTEIDGVAIHLLHVRSPHANALPLIMTHGWPGSVVEFLGSIRALTEPEDPNDAFHLVLPSIPGYGFSDKPMQTGWGVPLVAAAWAKLMARLGYSRYGAQGGDWGAAITISLGQQDAAHLVGIHFNLGFADPAAVMKLGELTADEQAGLAALQNYVDNESGYSNQQATRPQTLGYGLADSPAGQAAWIIEKFKVWADCDGHPENVFSRDDLLDNVMTYWLTNSGASSARLYWESFKKALSDFSPVEVTSAYSVFKDIFTLSERWAKTRFSDLRYYNRLSKGGHFAAFEQPESFVREVRAAFRAMK
jgi:pimeloyl-ACP methyl ester carboxylesterase